MKPSTPTACLNCGMTVRDRFCPRCGQAAEDRRAPLRRLLHEFLSETLSLESRLFRGLRDLFFRAGRLTEAYLQGKRASQLPPVRLYLVTSLIFVFLFSLTPPDASNMNVYVGDQLIGRETPDPDAKNLRIRRVERDEERLRQMDPQGLVDAIYASFTDALPKALVLFLPLLAWILKLLFLRSGILYFDHVIFALHLQSFLFCLLSLSWFLPLRPLYWLAIFTLVAPVYLVLALRRVYGQGWSRAALKTAVLLFAYLLILVVVFSGMLVYVATSV